MDPADLRYNESHEWAGLSGDAGENLAVVGITDFALEQLTDLVFMELPEVGSQVSRGEQFGEVESVKAVSPLYSPVTGEVVAVNSNVTSQLDGLANDPFGEGWLIKVRMSNPSEWESMMDRDAYLKQCAQ
jgi:glycine cleavage system H protein